MVVKWFARMLDFLSVSWRVLSIDETLWPYFFSNHTHVEWGSANS